MKLDMRYYTARPTDEMYKAIDALFKQYDYESSDGYLPRIFLEHNLLQHPLVWEYAGSRWAFICRKNIEKNSYVVFLAKLKGDLGYAVDKRYNLFRYSGAYIKDGEGCKGYCETCDGRAPILCLGENGVFCFMFYSYQSECNRKYSSDWAERNMLLFDKKLTYLSRSITQVSDQECSFARLAV